MNAETARMIDRDYTRLTAELRKYYKSGQFLRMDRRFIELTKELAEVKRALRQWERSVNTQLTSRIPQASL